MNSVTKLFKTILPVNIICRNYAFKSDLKIKWVRPEKIPHYKPEKSGDLKGKYDIDSSKLRYEFRESKELETANELVRKLFTIQFGPKSSTDQLYREELVNKVKCHDLDETSEEAKIARWTGIIRGMQVLVDKYPRGKKRKIFLQELIDKRKKKLKLLRQSDYKRFEWLIEQLDLIYKPLPEEAEQITRKRSLRKLTDQYCENIKQEKLAEYRLQLETEKPAFLEEKIRCLDFIRTEQQECGQEVTVTQEEIDETKRQLQSLKDQNEKRMFEE